MGHNPSRGTLRRLGLQDALQVDEFKARAVWGRWWQLGEAFRARFFNADELRFVKRYGSRLDQLASLVVVPRNEQEMPATDRERLWLPVQMAVRYEDAVKRAAICTAAMETAAGLDAEVRQLRQEARLAEADASADLLIVRMREADAAAEVAFAKKRAAHLARLCGLANVDRASLPVRSGPPMMLAMVQAGREPFERLATRPR